MVFVSVCTVVERVDGRQRCALLNETLFSPPRATSSAERRPGVETVGLGDLTNTRLLWIVVMSALSGTCLVLLTVAVAALMRRLCSRHHHQQPTSRDHPHHSTLSWRPYRRHRISGAGDCEACRHSSPPLSRLQLADLQQSDVDLVLPSARCDASDV